MWEYPMIMFISGPSLLSELGSSGAPGIVDVHPHDKLACVLIVDDLGPLHHSFTPQIWVLPRLQRQPCSSAQ